MSSETHSLMQGANMAGKDECSKLTSDLNTLNPLGALWGLGPWWPQMSQMLRVGKKNRSPFSQGHTSNHLISSPEAPPPKAVPPPSNGKDQQSRQS